MKAAGNNADPVASGQEQLRVLTNKKLTNIVKERISDIKLQQTAVGNGELNFNFDLPDFSSLIKKDEDRVWSYSFNEKSRGASGGSRATNPVSCNCEEAKERPTRALLEKKQDVIILRAPSEERLKSAPATRVLKVVRI
jgi:hypothetical protein